MEERGALLATLPPGVQQTSSICCRILQILNSEAFRVPSSLRLGSIRKLVAGHSLERCIRCKLEQMIERNKETRKLAFIF